MPKLHLKQARFNYSACRHFTKHRERIQKFREIGNSKHLHRNELDKICFAYDAAYPHSKDLAKKTVSDKILKDTAYENARNPKYNGCERPLASMVFKFFDKKAGTGGNSNEELAAELQKLGINKSIQGLQTIFGEHLAGM